MTPLAYHGGNVQTHALQSGSIAIDAGTNPLNLANDARDAGFARTVGSGTDLGAYERQAVDDQLFYAGFESAP